MRVWMTMILWSVVACDSAEPPASAAPDSMAGAALLSACASYCRVAERQCGGPASCEADCRCREPRGACWRALAAYLDCSSRAVLRCDTGEPVICGDTRDAYNACRAAAAAPDGGMNCASEPQPDGGGADAPEDLPLEAGPDKNEYRRALVSEIARADSPDAAPSGHQYQVRLDEVAGGCVANTIGPWFVDRCPSPEPAVTPRSAGEITFRAASGFMRSVMPSPADGAYASLEERGVQWREGDAVTIEAAGSPDIPAFRAMLTQPPALSLVSPTLSSTGSATVSLRQSLTVVWSAGAGMVRLRFAGILSDRVLRIDGYFDRAAGSASIPIDVLGELTARSARANLNIAPVSSTVVTAGTWRVRVTAEGVSRNIPLNFF